MSGWHQGGGGGDRGQDQEPKTGPGPGRASVSQHQPCITAELPQNSNWVPGDSRLFVILG